MATYQIAALNTELDAGGTGGFLVAGDSAGNWYALRKTTSGSGDWQVYYSTNQGVNWSLLGAIGLSVTGQDRCGLFVTAEDQLFAYGESQNTGDYRINGWDLDTADPSLSTDRGDVTYTTGGQFLNLVAFRDGTDDYILIGFTNNSTQFGFRVWKVTSGNVWSYVGAETLNYGNQYYSFIDLENTGDGITPPTGGPDVYMMFSEQVGSFNRRFVKFSYVSAGNWTVGTEVAIWSGSAYQYAIPVYHQPTDEIFMFARNSTDYKIYVSKRNAADTTTTALTTSAAGSSTSMYEFSTEYQPGGNIVRVWQWGLTVDQYNDYNIDTNTWSGWSADLAPSKSGNGLGIAKTVENIGWSTMVYEGVSSDFDIDTITELVYASIVTDSALASSNVLYVDELRGLIYVIDTVLGVNDWSDPDWDPGDWYYGEDDQLYVDVLTQTKVLQDTALVSINQLFVDGIDATRFLTDTQLEAVNQFYPFTLERQVNASPYWRWRFVRQNGHLFLIPAKSAQGWSGADVVSVDFRYNSDLMDYAMTSLVSAWATHSGSATTTLKAAIDTALGDAGFKDMQGNAIT